MSLFLAGLWYVHVLDALPFCDELLFSIHPVVAVL